MPILETLLNHFPNVRIIDLRHVQGVCHFVRKGIRFLINTCKKGRVALPTTTMIMLTTNNGPKPPPKPANEIPLDHLIEIILPVSVLIIGIGLIVLALYMKRRINEPDLDIQEEAPLHQTTPFNTSSVSETEEYEMASNTPSHTSPAPG